MMVKVVLVVGIGWSRDWMSSRRSPLGLVSRFRRVRCWCQVGPPAKEACVCAGARVSRRASPAAHSNGPTEASSAAAWHRWTAGRLGARETDEVPRVLL